LDDDEFNDALGEDEFSTDELDADDLGNELDPASEPDYEDRRPTRHTLPDLAARLIFKWGSHASASLSSNGNGHHSIDRSRGPGGLLADRYLDELEADLLEGTPANESASTWAAALRETYELMQGLAGAAAATRSSAEAQGLIAALPALSLQLVPRAYRALWPALPALIRGAVSVTGLLHRQPATRPLIATLPAAMSKSVVRLAQYRAYGRPITKQLAARVFAREVSLALRHSHNARPATRHTRGRPRRKEEWWDDGYR
jgi:hypothetical protein